jgi:hypothetical protein
MLKCKGNSSLLIALHVCLGVDEYFLIFSYFFIRESDWSQLAYVTFKDSQGADTAVLLSVCSSSTHFFIILIRVFYDLRHALLFVNCSFISLFFF